jgi:NTE family protein
MGKLALVISGGACKGAFAVGVLDYIFNNIDIEFDIICGTSTGALMIPSIISGNIPHLDEVYSNVNTKNIVKIRDAGAALETGYVLNTDPLNQLIKKEIQDNYDDFIKNTDKFFYIATTCLQTQKVTYFGNKKISRPNEYDYYDIHSKEELIEATRASSFQPVFMQPVSIRRPDNVSGEILTREYVDGGVTEYLPIQAALDAGADKIISIVHSKVGEGSEEIVMTGVFQTLMKTLGIALNDVSMNDFNRAQERAPGKVLDAIQPKKVLAKDGLIFEPTKMRKNIEHGKEIAKTWFDKHLDDLELPA